MTDTDKRAHDEAVRSWRRFFLGMLVLVLVIFALVLRSDHPDADRAGTSTPSSTTATSAPTAAPSATPTTPASPAPTQTSIPATPGAATAASKALIAYTKSPVDYIAKALFAQAQQANPDASNTELAAIITPPGLTLKPDASTWVQTSKTVGTIRTTATWTGQTTAINFVVTMTYEAGTWKVLAIQPAG